MTKVIAHRGASSDAPENTLAAFKLAIEQGCCGIELDVHMTRDGELVVIHDETLDRTTTGRGYIGQHTYRELQMLDAGSWFSSQYSNERIPRLIDVLDLMKGKDLLLNIELKTGYIQYPGIEDKLQHTLSQYDSQLVIVSSFNHYSLRTLKQIAPHISIGLLYMEGLVEPWLYAQRLGACSLHPFYLNIIPELVTGCKQAGVKLFPWTIDDIKTMRRVYGEKVEGIITNRPVECLKIVGGAV